MKVEIEKLDSLKDRTNYKEGFRFRVRVWDGQYLKRETLHTNIYFAKYDVDYSIKEYLSEGY